ncbi:hypothetical protein [Deinococcus aquaticus]
MKIKHHIALALLLALLGGSAFADPFGGTAPKPEPDRIVTFH